VGTLNDATVMPTAAIQRGSIGTFVYVVTQEKKINVRTVQLGPTEGDNVAVTGGLSPGELVVVIGGDKLREGSKVEVVTNDAAGVSSQRKKVPRDDNRKGGRQ
jgi:membrane fusion protein, multidrug efflux system